MTEKTYTLFAWIQSKKTKIGYAVFNDKYGCLRLKADPHLDATKIGRALMKGEIQIDERVKQARAIVSPEPQEFNPTEYRSAADDADAIIEASEAIEARRLLDEWE